MTLRWKGHQVTWGLYVNGKNVNKKRRGTDENEEKEQDL